MPEHLRVDAGEVALHVARWRAEAPPLLLLPAMTQTWADWLPVVPFFAAYFDIAAVDLRGHGESDHPEAQFRVRDYAADIFALTAALGWTGTARPAVIGHSLGGTVAQFTEATYPRWARRVVIEDSPLQLDSHDRRAALLAKAYLRMYERPIADIEAHFRRRHADWSEAQVRDAVLASRATAPAVLHEYLAHAPLTLDETLHGMHCPVLLVHGDEESGGFVSDADVGIYLAALPDGQAIQISGAGHGIHARKPDAFAAAVLPFLRENGTPDGRVNQCPQEFFGQEA